MPRKDKGQLCRAANIYPAVIDVSADTRVAGKNRLTVLIDNTLIKQHLMKNSGVEAHRAFIGIDATTVYITHTRGKLPEGVRYLKRPLTAHPGSGARKIILLKPEEELRLTRAFREMRALGTTVEKITVQDTPVLALKLPPAVFVDGPVAPEPVPTTAELAAPKKPSKVVAKIRQNPPAPAGATPATAGEGVATIAEALEEDARTEELAALADEMLVDVTSTGAEGRAAMFAAQLDAYLPSTEGTAPDRPLTAREQHRLEREALDRRRAEAIAQMGTVPPEPQPSIAELAAMVPAMPLPALIAPATTTDQLLAVLRRATAVPNYEGKLQELKEAAELLNLLLEDPDLDGLVDLVVENNRLVVEALTIVKQRL